MDTLRKKLIRLAYHQPRLRPDLLPLIRQAEEVEEQPHYSLKLFEKDFVKPFEKQWDALNEDRPINDLKTAYDEAQKYETAFTDLLATLDEAVKKYHEGRQLVTLRFPLFELIGVAGAYRSALWAELQREQALSAPRLEHLTDLKGAVQNSAASIFDAFDTTLVKLNRVLPPK